MGTDRIPVVMISDDNYVMQTCVAITSLKRNKNVQTKYEIIIVMAECSEASEQIFQSMDCEECQIVLLKASLEQYKDIKQLAHIPIACLLKFDICELIPQHDKLLYMDGDVIVRKDLTELFNTELRDNYAAAVKETNYLRQKSDGINAGIMLFNAAKMRQDNMRAKLVAQRKALGDRGSMDQQTYNILIKDKVVFLGIKYNCVPGRFIGDAKMEYTIEEINAMYGTNYTTPKQMIEDAVILHFATGNKPWKYTFAPCAKEWYKYYLESPFKDKPFKRYGRWGYRFHNMFNILKKDGIKGTLYYLKQRKERKNTKKEVKWE